MLQEKPPGIILLEKVLETEQERVAELEMATETVLVTVLEMDLELIGAEASEKFTITQFPNIPMEFIKI